MDQLEAMRAFVKIADAGSLTAAARALGVSVAAVTRGLAALEKRLAVRLVNRTTRRTGLTELGVQYYEHCRRVLVEIEAAEAALSAQGTLPPARSTSVRRSSSGGCTWRRSFPTSSRATTGLRSISCSWIAW